jgi:hypothetical protein
MCLIGCQMVALIEWICKYGLSTLALGTSSPTFSLGRINPQLPQRASQGNEAQQHKSATQNFQCHGLKPQVSRTFNFASHSTPPIAPVSSAFTFTTSISH